MEHTLGDWWFSANWKVYGSYTEVSDEEFEELIKLNEARRNLNELLAELKKLEVDIE